MHPEAHSTLALIRKLYALIRELESLPAAQGRKFTPDGHLVGTLGEVYAAEAYEIKLHPMSQEKTDGNSSKGPVQIKTTQGKRVSFYANFDGNDYLLVLLLKPDGLLEEVYNGPSSKMFSLLEEKTIQKNGQKSISLYGLKKVMKIVSDTEKIPLKTNLR